MLEQNYTDVRHALRIFRKSPVFALTVVASLAIGIGANTTIFTLVNSMFFRDRPGIVDPGRLVDVGRGKGGADFDNNSYPNYRDLRDRNDVLEDLAAYRFEARPMGLGVEGSAVRIFVQVVSGNYFSVLGTPPAAGRLLTDDDDRVPGEAQVVVLSHRLWRERFGEDASRIGSTVILNGRPYTVVGVAPPRFNGTSFLAPDAWIPIHSPETPADLLESRRSVWLMFVGRLKPGVSPGQAEAALATLGETLQKEYPQENQGAGVVTAPSAFLPPPIAGPVAGFMGLLMAIVGLVLVITCVNVASLLLARTAGRRGEVAVRLTLGAPRRRLVAQLVTESVVLAVLGGAAGLALAQWMAAGIVRLLPRLPVPVSLDLALDSRVLAFVAAATLLAGVLSGMAPALQATRGRVYSALKADGGRQPLGKLRLRSALVVSQVALSMLILVAAGLLYRSLREAAAIDPGFDPEGVQIVSLDLSLAGYDEKTGPAFAERLLAETAALPGVRSSAYCRQLPLAGGGFALGGVVVPGRENPSEPHGEGADWNIVTPGYMATMGIPLLRGRDFNDADAEGAPGVAIVNETMAKRFWPDENPIGKVFYDGPVDEGRPRTVVGVVRDGKYRFLGEDPRLFVYVPLKQNHTSELALLMRADGAAVGAVRGLLRSMNPNLPIIDAQPMSEFIGFSLTPQRIALSVAGGLGLVTLLLAGLGIYGVTAYAAQRRRREMGIRTALGATRREVFRLLVGHGLGLAAVGVGAGSLAGLAASRGLANLLYGIDSTDPLTFASSAGFFIAVAALASWLPARRAASVDPAKALRCE